MSDKVKIGIITGSLRKSSINRALARGLKKICPHNMELIDLPPIGNIPHYNQDNLDENGVPISVKLLSEEIELINGVIIVSPEYNWSIPGVLKNALDWISRVDPCPLQLKPVTIYTTSPGLLGGARAHAPIRNVLTSLDCRVMAKPEVQIGKAMDKVDVKAGTISDQKTIEFLEMQLAKFVQFINYYN